MITRYGYDTFLIVTAACLVVALAIILLVEPKGIRLGLLALPALMFLLTLNFFRDPGRNVPAGDALVLAPADGKVIQVRESEEQEYLKSPATLVSIFMSPLDVHVNRTPVTGRVGYYRYVRGEYFAAFADKASEKNEQAIIGMENSHGKVLFKQIAGFIARRIVCTLKVGDSLAQGERFGMIKFGSRSDVFLPPNTAVKVRVGDRAIAGETILGEFQ